MDPPRTAALEAPTVRSALTGAISSDACNLVRGGARERAQLALINARAYQVRTENVSSLLGDPDVESVTEDNAVSATTFTGSPDYGWMGVLGVSSPTAAITRAMTTRSCARVYPSMTFAAVAHKLLEAARLRSHDCGA